MISYANVTKTNGERISEFREAADKICAIASKYSVKITGYHTPTLPLYSALSSEKQSEALYQLKVFLQSMETTEAMGDRLDSQDRALWHALLTFGLLPPSGMFAKFKPDDVIEIYDPVGIQIWRNFNFMKICSYSLEEMHAIDWTQRYTRSADKVKECLEKIGALLRGETPEVYDCLVSAHVFEETLSQDCFKLEATHNWFARLKDRNGQVTAWLAVSDVKLLGQDTQKTRRAKLRLSVVATPFEAQL